MAAFDFPNSPSTNDTYTANGVTFQWNGSVWTRYSASQGAQGSTGAQGAQGAVGSPGAQGSAGAQGAQGHQGAVGAQGAAGAQGAQGHQGVAGSNASISSNANNRVITGGSGTNLVGESNLTFDGTTLSATGQFNLAGHIFLQPGGTSWSSTSNRPLLGRQADGELRLGAGSDSSSNITFYTSPSAGGALVERLRINTTGDVGINYDGTPNATLDIRTDRDPSNGLMCFIRNNAQYGNGAFYGMDVNSVGTWSVGMPDNTNVLSIRDGGQGNSGTEYLRIASNYLVTVGNNNISSTTQPSKLRVQGSYVNAVGPFGILEFKNRDNSGEAVCSIRGVRDAVAGGNYSAGLTFHTNSSNPASASDGDVERLRITSTGKITMGSTGETSTGLLLLDKDLTAESDVSDKSNYHLVIRSQSDSNTSKIGIAFANTSNDTHVGAAILHHRETTDSVGSLAFYTSPSSGTTTERMKIDRYGNVTKPNHCAFRSNMSGQYGGVGSLTTTVANVGILQSGEVYDRGNNYNTSTYLFTCPVDGVYMVNVFVSLGNIGSSRHIFVIAYTNSGGSTPLQNYFECIDGNTSSYANYSYCEPWYFPAGTTIGVGKNGMSGYNANYQMQWGVHLLG